MSEERFHFEIPKENIRREEYEKSGRGTSVKRSNHRTHGQKLSFQTNSLKDVEIKRKDAKYTSDLYLEIETPPKVPIKSQKLNLENLGIEIIEFSSINPSVGIAKIKKDILPIFERRLNDYTSTVDNVGKTYFSAIEDIRPIPLERKIRDDIDLLSIEKISIVINLYKSLPLGERLVINNLIVNELKENSEEVEERSFSNGITSISSTLASNKLPIILSSFASIKEVKLNYSTFVSSSFDGELLTDRLEVKSPISNSSICIIDSGISTSNNILKNLITKSFSFLPKGAIANQLDHGTFVASRALFGDKIYSCLKNDSLEPYCKVIDVSVFGIDKAGKTIGPNEFHLRKVIEDIVIEFHQKVKVYNLSLGSTRSIQNYDFSDLAKLIDFLSKKYKVLFVIATGNIKTSLGHFPNIHFSNVNARISCPAESLLSLSIGGITKFHNDQSLSFTDEISPFSKIGPGADLGMKPELVAHGGNLLTPYSVSNLVSTYGLSTDGKRLCSNVGTSFSAPIVSQYAQRLFDLYPNSDPNLVKALLCHFTERRNAHSNILTANRNFTGFGEPIIERATSAGENNAAYISESQLDQNTYTKIKFLVPSLFSEKSIKSKLKIKVTITFDPEVNPSNSFEYSCTRISAKIYKPALAGLKAIGSSKKEMKYLHPWNPILQFEKEFSRSLLKGGWELSLRLYTRGNLPKDYKQDFAVIIEIIDLNNKIDVYKEIIKESKSYKPIDLNLAA